MGRNGPRTEVTISPPSQTELAYLAGILDGEGHVRISMQSAGLALCMADVAILDWVHQHFSGTYSGEWINEKNANKRPRRMWHLNRAADLAFLLPQLDPYLVLKRAECAVLSEIAAHSLGPGYSEGGRRSAEWRARKEALVAAGKAAARARR